MKKHVYRVWDYCQSYNGHLVLRDENGRELANTIKSNGEICWDAYGYEIIKITYEGNDFVAMIVK